MALLHASDRTPGAFSRYSFVTCNPDRKTHALDPLLDRLEDALVDPAVARRRRRRARVLAVVGGLVALVGTSALGLVLASDDDEPTSPTWDR